MIFDNPRCTFWPLVNEDGQWSVPKDTAPVSYLYAEGWTDVWRHVERFSYEDERGQEVQAEIPDPWQGKAHLQLGQGDDRALYALANAYRDLLVVLDPAEPWSGDAGARCFRAILVSMDWPFGRPWTDVNLILLPLPVFSRTAAGVAA